MLLTIERPQSLHCKLASHHLLMYNLVIVSKASQYKHLYFLMKPYQSKINQSTKKRGNTRNKMEGHTSTKTKKTHQRGWITRGTPSSQTPLARSISNKERGGLPKRTASLKKPSPIATAPLKIEIVVTVVTLLTPFAYKMHVNFLKKGLQFDQFVVI